MWQIMMQWCKIWLKSTHRHRLNLNWDSNERSSEAFCLCFFSIYFQLPGTHLVSCSWRLWWSLRPLWRWGRFNWKQQSWRKSPGLLVSATRHRVQSVYVKAQRINQPIYSCEFDAYSLRVRCTKDFNSICFKIECVKGTIITEITRLSPPVKCVT